MSTLAPQPCGVHLVGSVPLATAEQVLRAVATTLGQHVRRVPDGETGERTAWAAFQLPLLARNPAFEGRGVGVMRAVLRGYSRSRLVARSRAALRLAAKVGYVPVGQRLAGNFRPPSCSS